MRTADPENRLSGFFFLKSEIRGCSQNLPQITETDGSHKKSENRPTLTETTLFFISWFLLFRFVKNKIFPWERGNI
jgi:hypothetical protein